MPRCTAKRCTALTSNSGELPAPLLRFTLPLAGQRPTDIVRAALDAASNDPRAAVACHVDDARPILLHEIQRR